MSEQIIKIPRARWEKDIAPVMDEVFDSSMPDAETADFYGVYDRSGRIKAFILTEKIVMVGQIYVCETDANKNNGQLARNLVNYILKKMPPGVSVGAVASEKRFEGLFRILKMQKITGTFFRRNL